MASATLPPQIEIHPETRKRFTRNEVERMLDADLFAGQRLFGMERILVQAPVDVAPADQERNFPEPDSAVLIANSPEFEKRHPRGNELLSVMEVAQTSPDHDRTTKRDLYARAAPPNTGS